MEAEHAFYEMGRRDMLAQVLTLVRHRCEVRSVMSDMATQLLKAIPDHPHATWVRNNLDRVAPFGPNSV